MTNDTNTNSSISDSLKVDQNEDGTFSFEWDKNDPNWQFLNGMTSKELQSLIENEINREEI
jgi:hypothetical protein